MQENENPKGKLWFKRKCYGWGWYPVSWEGWLVTIAYAIVIIGAALTLDETAGPRDIAFTFALPIVLSTVAMIRIGYRKGERPKWQWGEKKGDVR